MRNALPLWHCLSGEAQDRLIKLTKGDKLVSPPCEWKPWLDSKLDVHPSRDAEEAIEYYDKFMRKAPRHQKRVT